MENKKHDNFVANDGSVLEHDHEAFQAEIEQLCDEGEIKKMCDPEVARKEIRKDIREAKKEGKWPYEIAKRYGIPAAYALLIGLELLEDEAKESYDELENGTAPEETSLAIMLPKVFSGRYDNSFYKTMLEHIEAIREIIRDQAPFLMHSVLDELIIYLAIDEAEMYFELCPLTLEALSDYAKAADWYSWVADHFEDDDTVLCLYTFPQIALCEESQFAFEHWTDNIFWMGTKDSESNQTTNR